MWAIGTTECCSSDIKRSEALTHTIVWMSLENIIPSEVSQTQGKIPYDCTYVKYLALAKSSRQKVRGMGRWGGSVVRSEVLITPRAWLDPHMGQ